jgi:hypothetical protein
MIRNALLVVTLTGCASIALAQEFPVWERLLRHYSGKTDETPVPSMKMGRHMQMSLKGDSAPGDAARAAEILAAAEAVLCHYGKACRAAQGLWIPVVLNWMTHVYPNEQEK